MNKKAEIPSVVPVDSSSNAIKVTVDEVIKPNQIQTFSNKTPIIFKSNSGSASAVFEGALTETRNPGSTLKINDVATGNVDGVGVIDGSFSPDNRYFSTRTVSMCGAGCWTSTVYVADITNSKLQTILPPRMSDEYNGDTAGYLDKKAEPTIESYVWDGNSLKITFFFLGRDKATGKTYRISSKEIWKYNLITREYSLIETLTD
jgi:hypothetical protein